MGRAEVLQGVRQMRFEGLLERHERGELSQGEAAEMLGVSERTFRRWRDRRRRSAPARIPGGRLATFHGPHRLADYDPAGKLCDNTKLAA